MIERGAPRDALLDGVRAIAVILVLLSHTWVLAPSLPDQRGSVVGGLFNAGSLGVCVFMVLSGYLLARSLTRTPRVGPWRGAIAPFVRRTLRISVSTAVLVGAIVLTSHLDRTDTTPRSTTNASIWPIATYTWNWWVREHPLASRADLGHLWYLSAEFHVLLVLVVAMAIAPKRMRIFGIAAGVLALASTYWGWHTLHTEGWYSALARTSTRAQPALFGIALALLASRVRVPAAWSRWLLAGGLTVLSVLVLTSGWAGTDGYFGWQSGLACLATGALLVAAQGHSSGDSGVVRALRSRGLGWIGRASLSLYLWHYPLFFAVDRHTSDQPEVLRVAVGYAVLLPLTVALHRFLDTPVQRLTARIGPIRPRAVGNGQVQPTSGQSTS